MASMEDDEIIDGSGDEQEDITPADILQRLRQSWIDERMCPELLEYDGDVVDCMLDQIHQMEANLKRVSKTDFKISIHKMEVDRIRYLIASYLRCRLQKIELYHRHLLASEELRRRLSPEELKFATEFQAGQESHFQEVALQHMPSSGASASQPESGSEPAPSAEGSRLGAAEATVAPSLDAHVYLRADVDCVGVLIADEAGDSRTEELDLVKGSQYLLRYEPISKLLHKGDVHLI
ncbi:DNA replication complex GINS protein SLD5-like [Pollicipes pollicipes]|uniref:DNA replication complex GINS protein SLD5-like n=1 Tax=Pollicipes pollicipes TaxID=41117 RepID=UPI001884E1E0|nr:DNA replication complex GINS protein SLD5-like [Pollicipes pollicipes]